jgi:hypothetical protein
MRCIYCHFGLGLITQEIEQLFQSSILRCTNCYPGNQSRKSSIKMFQSSILRCIYCFGVGQTPWFISNSPTVYSQLRGFRQWPIPEGSWAEAAQVGEITQAGEACVRRRSLTTTILPFFCRIRHLASHQRRIHLIPFSR